MSPARRVLVPLALVVGSVLLALGGIEVLLRLTASPPIAPPPLPALRADLPVIGDVPELTAPYVRGVIPPGVYYRTNSAGFRGREYAQPKPSGVFRIAVSGDSVTMGAGVVEKETYPAQLEKSLNEQGGPITYEVLNLGIAGLNAPAIVDRLENVGLPYDPDLVLYGYTLNDLEGPAYRSSQTARTNIHALDARESHRPGGLRVASFLRSRLRSLRELLAPPEGSYVAELSDNYFHNPAAWATVEQSFDRLAAIGRERGVCVLVVQHTSLWFLHRLHPFRRHHAAVSRAAAARGLHVKETLDYFLGEDALSLWVNVINPHPNGRAHAILARATLDALRALPPGCWRRSEGAGAP